CFSSPSGQSADDRFDTELYKTLHQSWCLTGPFRVN
ncbi:MAG: hypothetical protein ACI9DC_000377, partial [Gammaproteobacteria bacterium]